MDIEFEVRLSAHWNLKLCRLPGVPHAALLHVSCFLSPFQVNEKGISSPVVLRSIHVDIPSPSSSVSVSARDTSVDVAGESGGNSR